ncbi:uncharacterized protein LOC132162311 [Corylus avellana]|uniref:uncharacterized protein LOC132162311 n=1 Tax=Corylus avellana TaxID=13451 RepID=UPI00286B6DF6|nr:uncharacterized protein LOC132162311 [Corylus avellana]
MGNDGDPSGTKLAGPNVEILKKLFKIRGLLDIQAQIHGRLSEALKEEINGLLEQEELKWRQRAKENWLRDGDRNNKYFHACANQRRRRNQIEQVDNSRGQPCTSQDSVEQAFIEFYQDLFTSAGPHSIDDCIAPIEGRLSNDMKISLTATYTEDGVYKALMQMTFLKAPGPDGFSAEFYQQQWSTVGRETDQSLQRCLQNHCKGSGKSTQAHASICHICQSECFYSGGLISDSIVAVYETLHTMQTRLWSKVGYMGIKLDMSRAYDRVEWAFLEAVMHKMEFPASWIKLIMGCVSSVSYAIQVNRLLVGNIQPSRGLWQGDPLSPYLFLLCAESLSALLTRAEKTGVLTGVPTSKKGPRLSHLFFADDSLIFCKANSVDWRLVTKLLDKYKVASGQKLYKEKTSIIFSRNTSQAKMQEITQLLGLQVT